MADKLVVNEHMDVRWHHGVPRVFIDDEPFIQCAFLVVSVSTADPSIESASVDDLADRPGAKVLEGKDAVGMEVEGYRLSKDDVLWAFTSAIIGWYESGYNTNALGANLAFPLLKALARVGDAKAKRVLAGEIQDRLRSGHEGTSIAIVESCADLLGEDEWRVIAKNMVTWRAEGKRIVALNPNTPAGVLANLANDPDIYVRWRVAKNRSTPINMLAKLAYDPDVDVRKEVAFNPNTPASVLAKLAYDPKVDVRKEVASNSNTPASALANLAGDPDSFIRKEVADNHNTPAAALAKLVDDPKVDMRWLVAENPNTPAAALAKLADDPDSYVRWRVASNKSTPINILTKLAGDPDMDVRRAAEGRS